MSQSTSTFTYWSLLGLNPGCDATQLKTAFRREAMRWHPDLNKQDGNAAERFKWVNEAYKVLSDPKKRFEWEIAGQPTFEIKDLPKEPPEPFVSETAVSKPSHSSSGFDSGEKLLLLLISIFSLFFLNTFIL